MPLLQSMRWKTNVTKHSSGCSDRWRWETKTDRGSNAILIGRSCARTSGLANSFTRLLASYTDYADYAEQGEPQRVTKAHQVVLIHSSFGAFSWARLPSFMLICVICVICGLGLTPLCAILPLLALLGNRPNRMHRNRNIKQ